MNATRIAIRAHPKRRGTALVISLVAVMMIAGLGAGLVQMQAAINAKHSFSIDKRRALYVAEAGIAEAALAVSQGKSGIIANENVPAEFGRGLFWVETADLPDSRIALICTSRVGSAEFVLRTIVVPNLNPVASLGFFGAESVELGWGTVADGFHSGRGSFASQSRTNGDGVETTGDLLALGSNGDVLLDESVLGVIPRTPLSSTGPLPPSSGSATRGTLDPGSGTGAVASSPTLTSSRSLGGAGAGTGWEHLVAANGSTAHHRTAGGSTSDPTGSSTGGSTGAPTGAPIGGSSSGSAPKDSGSTLGVAGIGGPPPGDPTRLYGTLKPGPEGYVQSNGFSEVRGSIEPARYPENLPRVTYPSPNETISGDVEVSGTVTGVGTRAETRVTGTVRVMPGATLNLNGPCVLLANELEVQNGATLRLDDTNGPIFIYLRAGVDFATGSTLESLADHDAARGTSILLADAGAPTDRVTLQCSGTFHGIVYAPGDVLEIPASLRYYGSAVARILRTERGARLSYDRRLAVGGEGVPTLPRILSWQIVPVGDRTARRLRVDPMVELRLRGVTPLVPANAAPESNVRVQYIDAAGDDQTYSGPFATLNLGQVSRIIGLQWNDPRDGAPRDWLRPAGDDPTDAIANSREASRAARAGIRSVSGGEDVSVLTDQEILDLLDLLPQALASTLPADVQEMKLRLGGAPPTGIIAPLPFELDDWWDNSTQKDKRDDADATAGGAIPIPVDDIGTDE